MPLTVGAKNTMLNAFGAVALYASLHTADPGTTGASEVAGGTPAYARKAITWNAAAAADLDDASVPDFDIPAGTTVTHFGYWTAATGGTFLGGDPLSASEAFTAQGTYTLTDLDVTLNNAP